MHEHGRKHAGRRQKTIVAVFGSVGLVAILLQSAATWPVRVAVFAGAQLFLWASFLAVDQYYRSDDHE